MGGGGGATNVFFGTGHLNSRRKEGGGGINRNKLHDQTWRKISFAHWKIIKGV